MSLVWVCMNDMALHSIAMLWGSCASVCVGWLGFGRLIVWKCNFFFFCCWFVSQLDEPAVRNEGSRPIEKSLRMNEWWEVQRKQTHLLLIFFFFWGGGGLLLRSSHNSYSSPRLMLLWLLSVPLSVYLQLPNVFDSVQFSSVEFGWLCSVRLFVAMLRFWVLWCSLAFHALPSDEANPKLASQPVLNVCRFFSHSYLQFFFTFFVFFFVSVCFDVWNYFVVLKLGKWAKENSLSFRATIALKK